MRNARGKVVRTVRGRLNKRRVVVLRIPKARPGRYRLAATYAGNANVKAARKVVRIRVRRR